MGRFNTLGKEFYALKTQGALSKAPTLKNEEVVCQPTVYTTHRASPSKKKKKTSES